MDTVQSNLSSLGFTKVARKQITLPRDLRFRDPNPMSTSAWKQKVRNDLAEGRRISQSVAKKDKPFKEPSSLDSVKKDLKDFKNSGTGKFLSNLSDKQIKFNLNLGKNKDKKYKVTLGKLDTHKVSDGLDAHERAYARAKGYDIDKGFDHMGIKLTKYF